MEQKLQSILQKAGYRYTTPRQQVFACLSRTNTALSMGEITKLCSSIDRTSIYRTLELFTELRLINVITRGWKSFYELAEPFKPHHHHFTCDSCGEVLSIVSEAVENVIKQIESVQNVRVTTHSFELHGTCESCQKLTSRL